VVVASGAADGQAEHGFSDGVEGVVHDEVEVGVLRVFEAAGQGDKAGGDDTLPETFFGIFECEDVAGDLFDDELVVGHVVIEGVDDVVAVLVCFGDGHVGAVAGGIGVASEVEPMASPALAVILRGEESIDEFGEGVGGSVVEECFDLLRCGR